MSHLDHELLGQNQEQPQLLNHTHQEIGGTGELDPINTNHDTNDHHDHHMETVMKTIANVSEPSTLEHLIEVTYTLFKKVLNQGHTC